MAQIKVNSQIWDAISDKEREQITSGLIEHNVLRSGDKIVGDKNTPAPEAGTVLHSATFGDVALKGFLDDINPGKAICRIACDAAAAAAVAACTFSGPALAACMAAIAGAREYCRSRC